MKGNLSLCTGMFQFHRLLEQLSYISLASQETQIWNTSLETPKLWRHVASTYFCLWPGSLAHSTDVKGNPASLLGEASIRRKAITEMYKHHLPGWSLCWMIWWLCVPVIYLLSVSQRKGKVGLWMGFRKEKALMNCWPNFEQGTFFI